MPLTRKAAFLDRDGTIIVEKHYLANPDDVVLTEGAIAGLLIALAHQCFEQLLIFSTSEVPLASTAIMGAAGGGLCGLFIAWLNSE